MTTTYYQITETEDQSVHDAIVLAVQAILESSEAKVKFEEQGIPKAMAAGSSMPEAPELSSGKYVVSYFSESHKAIRYFEALPTTGIQKPLWSYKKKDAMQVTKKAAEFLSKWLPTVGYETPVKISKTMQLTVIPGGKKDGDNE
jgi:hypothetical protein